MAATNFTPIQLYFSTTASAVPLAANLAQGELAINIADGKLYYEDSAGVVQVIATKGAGTIGGSNTQIQYNNAGALAGNAAMTFNSGTSTTTLTTLNLTNALGAIYGGTAQSTYAQGDFLYASASNTLSKLGIGANTYILTSTGSVPQWSAPSSIIVQTATNLAGGLAGSVPYQSALDTTTFLAIGAANRVMTSTGSAPQWVTSLTGLTGVSSSSITNTSLTSGRVVVSSTAGLQADDADLTFDGTTLSAGGFSTVGLSTLVKTVKIGDSNFNGVAVFAAATPAKLYIGTGTVTDTTSAIGATNAVGAISSLAITPIAATNTSVTYTNAATLYIAGAPSAGTNVTITNPYSLYVAAGDAYFGGTVTAGTVNLTTLDLTNLEVTNIKAKDGTAAMSIADSTGVVTVVKDQVVNGLTVGRGAGAVVTNTAVGGSALTANTTGSLNTSVGYFSMASNTSGNSNTVLGYYALSTNTTGYANVAVGRGALVANTTGYQNIAIGSQDEISIYAALRSNTTGVANNAIGNGALQGNTTGNYNVALGHQSLASNTTASNNTAVGYQAGYSNTTGTRNVLIGDKTAYALSSGSENTVVGPTNGGGTGVGAALTSGSTNIFIGINAGQSTTTGSYNTIVGAYSPAATVSNTVALADGGGNARFLYLNSTAVQARYASSQTIMSNVSSSLGGLLRHRGIPVLGNPNGGTYKGYLILAKAYDGVVGQALSNVLGRFTFIRGGTGSGNRSSLFDVNCATAYSVSTVGISGMDQGEYAQRIVTCTYDSEQWLALETSQTGGIPDGGVFFEGTFEDAGMVYVDATYVSLISEFNSSVGLNVTDFDSTLILNSGQIQFPATQNASANANTLDDYEEGTWTPTFLDVTYTASATYTEGRYTKIGRVVTVVGVITTDALDTADGSGVIIGGLPFTVDAQNVSYTPAALFVEEGFNASGVNGYMALASPGTTNINVYIFITQSTTNNYGTLLYNQLTDGAIGTRIRFQITYTV